MKRFFRRLVDGLFVVLFFTSLVFIVFVLQEKDVAHIRGNAVVVDGDSIKIDGKNIRLAGIDSPELRQGCQKDDVDIKCGIEAKSHLKQLIGDADVECQIFGNDFYDRILAACFAGDVALNEQMVLDGWAIDYGGYADAETKAEAASRGIWATQFDRPQDFRRQQGARSENSVSHRVAFAKLNAIRLGAHLMRLLGLQKD